MSAPNKPLKLLFDIVLCIDLLEQYTETVSDAEALNRNQEKIDAIERRFGIIGEATRQLQRLDVKVPQRDWIINFRNTLIHQYDATFSTTLLRHIREDLPALREEVKVLMQELENPKAE